MLALWGRADFKNVNFEPPTMCANRNLKQIHGIEGNYLARTVANRCHLKA